jgi:hypothetical protein
MNRPLVRVRIERLVTGDQPPVDARALAAEIERALAAALGGGPRVERSRRRVTALERQAGGELARRIVASLPPEVLQP